MTELVDELEEKRAIHNEAAEKHREFRDGLNYETRKWVDKRDTLNTKVRELIAEANNHRENRDQLNAEVREIKTHRDNWNRLVSSLSERLIQLKREKMPQGGLPIQRLRAQMRALEKRHMTSVLTSDKEKALVDEIAELSAKIQDMEREVEQFEEIKQLDAEVRETKNQAEALHRNVSEYADRAQEEHDVMVKLFEEVDRLRQEADDAQEKFIETKLKADEEHRKHIDHIRQIHDFDKIIFGIKRKLQKSKKEIEEDTVKKEAEEIFDRFKSGEKLSTEDLMILQKSGYL